jgi:acyl-CoA thioesterase
MDKCTDNRTQFFREKDTLAQLLGIEMQEVRDGYARAIMPLREDLKNAGGTAHGGALFTLADAAFAAASNSYGSLAVAVNTSMAYLKPGLKGVLTAECKELSKGSKLATYHAEITDEAGTLLATFQGTVYRIGTPLDFGTKESA